MALEFTLIGKTNAYESLGGITFTWKVWSGKHFIGMIEWRIALSGYTFILVEGEYPLSAKELEQLADFCEHETMKKKENSSRELLISFITTMDIDQLKSMYEYLTQFAESVGDALIDVVRHRMVVLEPKISKKPSRQQKLSDEKKKIKQREGYASMH